MEQVISNKVLKRKPVIANNVFGMMTLVVTEVMFFTALISSFLVIKRDRIGWELPESVQLPITMTAINTGILFLSGILLYFAGTQVLKQKTEQAKKLLLSSAVLGLLFVSVQGYEWMQLLALGLDMRDSLFGALFFLIVGSHALHAFAGVLALTYGYKKLNKKEMGINGIYTLQIFWFFVVGVWPLLYYIVYFQ